MEEHPPASLARGGWQVAPALTLVNLVGYVLTVAAARALNPDAYGELAALLGVLLVVSVPALAVQAVVARAIARRPAGEVPGPRERALLLRAGAVGLVVSLAVAVTSPLQGAFLHVDLGGPLAVAAQLVPLAVLSGAMGMLQGAERFTALAVVICAQAMGKVVGMAPLLFDGGPVAVLIALGLGTAIASILAVLLARPARGPGPGSLPSLQELIVAATGLLALLVLANLDVLLARNVLSGDESGRYSAGSVLAKAAFWLPQAVAVVVFPRLSDPEAGRVLLRRAVLVVSGLGVLELLGCLLLARPVLELTFGTAYGSLAPIAWLWVVQGAVLSVVQLLVYRAIAIRDAVTARVVGVAAVVEATVVLLWRPTTPGPVIAVSAAIAGVLCLGLLARPHRQVP